jgi:hypothetical protein
MSPNWRTRLRVFAAWAVLSVAATFFSPLTAFAQRLETVINYQEQLWYRSSHDGGTSWTGWDRVGLEFVPGRPALASDRDGHYLVTAIRSIGYLGYYEYTPGNGFSPWRDIAGGSSVGVSIDGRFYRYRSDPAICSWGPGRFDVFILAIRDSDGTRALVHTWANNNQWTGRWEVLSLGWMQGTPAVVSWGPNRIDVFMRGGGNELVHKWYDGDWRPWENLGGTLPTDPAVTSLGPGHLQVFGIAGDRQLWTLEFQGWWSNWTPIGGFWPADPFTPTEIAPSATAPRQAYNEILLHRKDTDQLFKLRDLFGPWETTLQSGWPAGSKYPTILSWFPF